MQQILFNKPYISGNETSYVNEVISSGRLSGNGKFTKLCHEFFNEHYQFENCLLTTSCTSALEMAALLLNIEPGDEIIVPSFTFTSTANAFMIFGAKCVFIDSCIDNPNLDHTKIENLITKNTKAIVVVHYAGMACAMDEILAIAKKFNLYVIEDAAQAIDSFYTFPNGLKKRLGSMGHLATFSFHETKNITCGEGGLLIINEPLFFQRAEILWEKGTNRCSFHRGEINKYEWVDLGSSFLPSELNAAFLLGQLEQISHIQTKRQMLWYSYYEQLKKLDSILFSIETPKFFGPPNGHIFYIVCKNLETRNAISIKLLELGIVALFHYQSLNKSKFQNLFNNNFSLINSDRYSDCLLRLPLHANLELEDINYVVEGLKMIY